MTKIAKLREPTEGESFTRSVKGNSLMFLIVTATFILLAYSSVLYIITSESALEDQSTGNAVAGLVSTLGAAYPLADSAMKMGFNESDVLNSLSPAPETGDASAELLPFVINEGEIRVRESGQVNPEVIDLIINNLQNASFGDITLPNSSEPVRLCKFEIKDEVWIAVAAHLPDDRGMLGYAREISPYLLSGEKVQRQLIGFLVMAYVIFITLLVLVLRIITRPLKNLTSAAERFAKGDFTPINDVPKSIAELGILSNAFNRMGSDLENHRESLLEYSHKLETANKIRGNTLKELEKSNRELKAMTESAFKAIELEMPQQVIELTVKRLRDDLDLAGAALFVSTEKGDFIPRRLPGLPLSSGNTIPEETANFIRDCLDRAATNSSNGNLVRKLTNKTGEKLYVPMAVGYNTMGVLELAAKKGRHFDSDSERFLNHFIPHMEIILKNKALYQETIRRSHELERVNMISRAISGELDQDKLLRDVVEYTEKTIRAESAFIGILDSGRLYVKYITPGTANVEHWEIDPCSDPLINEIIRENQPKLTHDLDMISGLPDDGIVNLNDFRSFVGCPITHQGQVEGVLCGFSRIPNAFTSGDVYFLELLASQVAIAIANAKLFKEVISRDVRRDEQLRVAQKHQKDRIPQSFKHNVASLNCILKPADELA
ncbi:MAG: GAF domain-containing protein, partial [bacterium]